ncbi:unnamed protein product [Coffea canephora]|uniref:Uncharacterized protein n=1 Tax=Coffea canephora TaxID=49390 RepID=A0A068TS79_COFCA|nr:unnamed protein product [Coffea canephora]
MRALPETRRLARALTSRSSILLNSVRVDSSQLNSTPQWRAFCSTILSSSGIIRGNRLQVGLNCSNNVLQHWPMGILMQKQLFSSESNAVDSAPTESVKELHDKILKSISEQKSAPPNAWLWSLVQQSATREDIKLLFDVLQRLRIFRLSNLRIHENFNFALCQEVTKACVRVGAIDYGKKALWKHNLYGLTPNVGSAHQLLLYAKQHKDSKLMADIMELLKKNNLPLQAGTADIVFRICYETQKWGLLSKYAKRFIKAGGVNLRQATIDMWMEFAAKRGDVDSLWKVEKLRSESKKQHTLASGFSCAKGFLLESKPESAAAVIEELNQSLSDGKRQGMLSQLQKLVSEWPLEVIEHQKKEHKKDVAAALQKSIPAMIVSLSSIGAEVNVNLDDLTTKAGILS